MRSVSGRRRDSLMPDVFRCSGVNGVLANVGSVIAYALKSARDEN